MIHTTTDIIPGIKSIFGNMDFTPLHAPVFTGNERKYVMDAIDSTFVSSVGAYVNRFEEMICDTTGAAYAIAIVNGTNALHMAMIVAGVQPGDEVISQALTFVATANAISYIGAAPVFVDVDEDTLGMSPQALHTFLAANAEKRADGFTYNRKSGKRIAACVPMHTFGLPLRIDEVAAICAEWNIVLIEDAAESIGSYYKSVHTGRYGKLGVFSFNGNKTITCGGGGALITDDENLARRAKHLTTQAKVPHKWEFVHDEIGYNYRMPNLNAAMACAQLEQLPLFVENKRALHTAYMELLQGNNDISLMNEIPEAKSNYWLNAVLLKDREARDAFLEASNGQGVMTRPVWELMSELPMFKGFQHDGLEKSRWIADRLVNIPSSVRL